MTLFFTRPKAVAAIVAGTLRCFLKEPYVSIQTLGRYGIVLFLAALSSGCSSIIGECGLARSSCMYEGKYEQGEEDYAEAEAKRLNKQSTDRLRRSSGD